MQIVEVGVGDYWAPDVIMDLPDPLDFLAAGAFLAAGTTAAALLAAFLGEAGASCALRW